MIYGQTFYEYKSNGLLKPVMWMETDSTWKRWPKPKDGYYDVPLDKPYNEVFDAMIRNVTSDGFEDQEIDSLREQKEAMKEAAQFLAHNNYLAAHIALSENTVSDIQDRYRELQQACNDDYYKHHYNIHCYLPEGNQAFREFVRNVQDQKSWLRPLRL